MQCCGAGHFWAGSGSEWVKSKPPAPAPAPRTFTFLNVNRFSLPFPYHNRTIQHYLFSIFILCIWKNKRWRISKVQKIKKYNINEKMQEFTKKTSFYWSRSRRKKFKTAPAPKGPKSPALTGYGSTTLFLILGIQWPSSQARSEHVQSKY